MINDIGRGAAYLARGFSLVRRPGVRRFVLIPLGINILLFGGFIGWGYSQFQPLVQWLLQWVPGWLGFLEWLIWAVITSMTAVIVFFTFTPIANVIAAPFNAIMAEKLEEMLTGQEVNSGISLGRLIIDSIKSQLGKLVYISVWSIGLFLVGFIPVINLVSPFLWFIFGAWLLTLEYMDYPMGNHDQTFQQQKDQLKKRNGLALGFGGMVMALTSIPIVNFVVIPVAVAGATLMYVRELAPQTLGSAASRELQMRNAPGEIEIPK